MSADPLGLIIPRMPLKRAKRSFVERLLELGLIQDKKQCRKKRERRDKSKGHSENEDTSEGKVFQLFLVDDSSRRIVYRYDITVNASVY